MLSDEETRNLLLQNSIKNFNVVFTEKKFPHLPLPLHYSPINLNKDQINTKKKIPREQSLQFPQLFFVARCLLIWSRLMTDNQKLFLLETRKKRIESFSADTKILTLQFLFEIVIPPEFSRLQIVIIVYLRSVLFRWWHDDETRQYFLTTFCMLQYNSDYF